MSFLFTVIPFSLLISAPTPETDLTIGQAGREFSQTHIEVAKGTSVLFLNDDNVPHNIYTNSGGKNKDLGLSKPGGKINVVFDETGMTHVRCAIHPRMKMTVKVE